MQKALLKTGLRLWMAIILICIGYFVPEGYDYLFNADGSILGMGVFLITVLGGVRVFSAVIRRSLPFSEGLQAEWRMLRTLAKQYDSYQWRKLFWVGFGFAIHAVLSTKYRDLSWILASACGGPGLAGIFVWKSQIARDASMKSAGWIE